MTPTPPITDFRLALIERDYDDSNPPERRDDDVVEAVRELRQWREVAPYLFVCWATANHPSMLTMAALLRPEAP